MVFSYLSRDFYTALNAKDAAQFQEVLVKFTAALSAGVPVVVLNSFQRERLALRWREWLTERVLTLYLGSDDGAEAAEEGGGGSTASSVRVGAYYTIEAGSSLEASYGGSLDNPDQRIAEDVRSFTRSSLSFVILQLETPSFVESYFKQQEQQQQPSESHAAAAPTSLCRCLRRPTRLLAQRSQQQACKGSIYP